MAIKEDIEALTISNLPVQLAGTNYRTSSLRWNGKTGARFHLETCARDLSIETEESLRGLHAPTLSLSRTDARDRLLASEEVINPFLSILDKAAEYSHGPFPSDAKDPKFIRGRDAYEFLLRIFCGLESNVPADHEVVNQLRGKLTTYATATQQAGATDDSKRIIRILQSVLADAGLIRNRFYPSFTPRPQPEDSAIRLAGIKDTDTVMVVAGSPDVTEKAIRALANPNHPPDVRKVIIVHPGDPTDAGGIALGEGLERIRALQETQPPLINPTLEISTMPFKAACESGFKSADHVFVRTSANEQDLATHRQLVKAWRKRTNEVRRDGKIVLSMASPKSTKCSQLWEEAGFTGYISAAAVHADYSRANEAFREPLIKAARACEIVADARSQGVSADKYIKDLVINHLTDKIASTMQQVIASAVKQIALDRAMADARKAGISGPQEVKETAPHELLRPSITTGTTDQPAQTQAGEKTSQRQGDMRTGR